MDSFVIQGGARLRGTVRINGAKNAALPIMAGALLCDGLSDLKDVPTLSDITHLANLLRELGMTCERLPDGTLHLEVTDTKPSHARYALMRKMRAGICVLGPMVAKRGYARVSMPGGCAIGDRPIDIHLRGLAALGAHIELDEGDIIVKADRLKGAEVFLGGNFGSTVTGTANVLSAATLAKGTTMIECAACEPEVVDLANYLNACGAKIQGAGTPRITIEGVEALHGTTHTVIPDRIEAGTFMVAAAITNGEIHLDRVRLDHLMAATDKLRSIGVIVEKDNGGCTVASARNLEPANITTQPHPGFPTDLQAQFMALLSLAGGNSIITEKIYPDRFLHVAELARLGANLHKEGSTVVVQGVKRLICTHVTASDRRASAALVLAGLAARGTTTVMRVYHIDRGYEHIEQRLNSIGASIQRVDQQELDL